jgi:hypothetical protein
MVLKQSITPAIQGVSLPDRGLDALITELDENNQECLAGGNSRNLQVFLEQSGSLYEKLEISSTSTEVQTSSSRIPLWLVQ